MNYPIPKNQNDKNKTVGYRLGQALALIVIGCMAAIVLCLSIRLCAWILGF